MNINKRIKNKRKYQGSVLAYTLVVMVVVVIILLSIIQFLVSQIRYASFTASREESFQIAETGVNYFRWYLAHQVDGRTAQQIQDFWTNGHPVGVSTPYEVEYKDPSGAAVGKYRLEVTPPQAGSTIVMVKSTGWTYKYPDAKRIVQIRLRKPAWSEYMVLSNANIRFGSSTNVQGKIFSNGGVQFDGVATNMVYSAVNTYYDNDSDVHAWKPGVWTSWPNGYNTDMRSNVFMAGTGFPAANIDFNSISADLNTIKTYSQAPNGSNINSCTASGCYFDNSNQGRHIILNSNGTFRIRTVRAFSNNSNDINNYNGDWQTYNIPNDGVIFVENNVWIEGVINNKRVTIVAANLRSSSQAYVYINNNITYTNLDGRDVLGIIGQGDVETVESSPSTLTIDGAMIAQNGRVGRVHYSNNDHKNTITIYGAIATNGRYGFAYTDGTGYQNRNLIYDNNLMYNPPPFFPTGTQYLVDLWEEL